MNESNRGVLRPETLKVSAACALLAFGYAVSAQASDAGPDAALPGVEFRAVGYDPRWVFEEDRQAGIRFSVDGGKATIILPTPGLGLGNGSTGAVYGASSESHDLLAEIQEINCQDAISGERLSHTVTIRLDGREYRGCGKGLRAGETANR